MAEATLSAPAIRIYIFFYIRQVLFFRTLINFRTSKMAFRSSKNGRSQRLASSIGNFRDIGSKFRHETRTSEATADLCYHRQVLFQLIRKVV